MGGSDFCGVIEKNTPLCAHEIGPGLAIRRPDDAGDRCRVVGVAVGGSGDELVGDIEASERVHR
jgi:hypothetical protein